MAKVTQEMFDKVTKLGADGWTKMAIARRIGISHATVKSILDGKRGPTVGPNGRSIYQRNGWMTGVMQKRLAETGSIRRPTEESAAL